MKVDTPDGGEHHPSGEDRGDLKDLDPGERRAISLAVREEAGLLLIDARAGRLIARKHGVRVTGTIGVLGAAAQKGLIDPARAVRDLRETSFRATADLYRWLLDKGKIETARARGISTQHGAFPAP
jgi:predicted nucleic acid-binding protein